MGKAESGCVFKAWRGLKNARMLGQTGAEYGDISHETTIAPAQWKAKMASGERFIYDEPKVSCETDNGLYELRVKNSPYKNNPAAPVFKFNMGCSFPL